MISLVGRRPAAPPDWTTTAAAAERDSTAALAARARAKAKRRTKSRRRVGHVEEDFPPIWRQHKQAFATAHFDKCAYCESVVSASCPGQVEHYRPKALVETMTRGNRDDTKGSPKRTVLTRRAGYAWLAYSWSNYLYACTRCNSIWKRNQFPIAGPPATDASKLTAEAATLINPLDIDPAAHFEYDALTGFIIGATVEGCSTIDSCGLDRETLRIHRQLKGEKLTRRFDEYDDALFSGNETAARNALRAIFDECREVEAYAGMARYLAEKRVRLTYSIMLALYMKGEL